MPVLPADVPARRVSEGTYEVLPGPGRRRQRLPSLRVQYAVPLTDGAAPNAPQPDPREGTSDTRITNDTHADTQHVLTAHDSMYVPEFLV